MDDCANAHPCQDIGEYLPESGTHLFPGELNPLPPGKPGGVYVHLSGLSDKILHIRLHVQPLDQGAACHGDRQPYRHIDDGHLCPENAHQQDKAAQVYHGGGNQERERDP